MRVMLIGDGGREAALAWRLAQSATLTQLVVVADSPGWPKGTRVWPAVGVAAIVAAARELRVDLVVVGPEKPLADGLVDALEAVGILAVGPTMAAARLESSKSFARAVLRSAGVATSAGFSADMNDSADRLRVLERIARGDVVLKADGLAAGKGSFVCRTREEALAAFAELASGRFGTAASSIVVEERLEGQEVSLFALCDGKRALALMPCRDHKRLLDGDVGPNTGGMGALAPVALPGALAHGGWVSQIHQPVLDEMQRRGAPFRGILYAGVMLTAQGPVVLELNVRLGDPECQAIMALWGDDLLPWLAGAARGRLPSGTPALLNGHACTVVIAAEGYPGTPRRGAAVLEPSVPASVRVHHSGTLRDDAGVLRVAGGRVLSVTGVGDTAAAASEAAYAEVPRWHFDGAQFRSDIGR